MENKSRNKQHTGNQNNMFMQQSFLTNPLQISHHLMANPVPIGFYQNLMPINERPRSFSYDDSKNQKAGRHDEAKNKENKTKLGKKEAFMQQNETREEAVPIKKDPESLLYTYADEDNGEKREYLYSKV